MRRISVWMNLGATFTLALMWLFGFARIASAQAPTTLPLSLDNNYIVTGDYVVGGWHKTGPTTINGTLMSTGTISIPDSQAYATNMAQSVPVGADIVAAYLYWEAVENSGVHSGQNGFFSNAAVDSNNNLIKYPIIGTLLGNPNAPVSWSAGGCAGSSNGTKTIVTYRADVSGLIPANPNIPAYQVSLPDSGFPSVPPFAEGATLVIVYRLLAPTVPLNAVVIYDGAFAPSNQSLTMSQPIVGFIQAGNDQSAPVATKITHIVANGQANKQQQVYLNNYDANGKLVHSTLLPSLYGANPPFPGNYNGSWDNPTWFPNTYTTTPMGDTAVQAGESSEAAVVVPTGNKGCVTWGAIVMSVTVQDSDHDGLPDIAKANQGYCDPGANLGMSNQGTCPLGVNDPSWVALSGATKGEQDIFIQLDYMCTKVIGNGYGTTTCDPTGVSYKPNTQAISNLVTAFSSHGHNINVHIVPNDNNVILAQACADTTVNGVPVYCPFPFQTGAVGWKSGFSLLKTQPLAILDSSGNVQVNYPDEASCEAAGALCKRRFAHGQNNSYHEVIFGAAAGTPTWGFVAGNLTGISSPVNGTLTFTTLNQHGLVADPLDTAIVPNERITIFNAISNPNLNGTYLVQSVSQDGLSFTIQVPSGTAVPTSATDPFLLIASGAVSSVSGVSDVGGADSLITLGLWGADGQTVPVESGTFMHELGHTFALTHGGLYRTQIAGGYSFSSEPNCKPNFQSVMNYLFQVDLLDGVLDYSEEDLPTLNESIASTSIPSVLANAIHPTTKWYAPNQAIGTAATFHCDGTPLLGTDPPSYLLEGPASSITWTLGPGNPLGQDLNFDGQIEAALDGYSDWANIDLRQIGASGNDFWAGGKTLSVRGGAGIGYSTRGAQGIGYSTRGAAGIGYSTRGAQGEIDHKTASSAVRSPKGTSAALTPANTIQLNFSAPSFGQSQIASFNIYRAVNGAAFGNSAFANVPVVTGTPLPLPDPLTFTDTSVSCGEYSYFVTTVVSDTPPRESVPSNTASATPICSTTVTVTSSISPSTYGQAVTFTATVTDTTSTATPTGSVQFSIDGTACGGLLPLSGAAAGSAIATLTVSSAACTTTLAVNGGMAHVVRAVYSNADGSFNGSSGTVGQIVNPAPTSTGVISSANASIYGQSVTFTATVANTAGASTSTATPTGSVQFSIDGGAFGAPVPLSGSGAGVSVTSGATATLTVKGSPHTVKAVYSPNADGNFIGSSGTLNQNVNPAPTSTGVISSVNASIYGQSVTFTATVANTSPVSTATPTGSVQFSIDGGPFGAAVPLSGSGASVSGQSGATAALTVNGSSHTVKAVYLNADGNFITMSSGTVGQNVKPAPTSTTVSSSVNPSIVGQSVTFTATVANTAVGVSTATPTGSVQFMDNGTPLVGTVQIVSGVGTFTATLTISTLAVGTHPITAVYSNSDGNFLSTASAIVNQLVQDFTITVTPSAQTIPSGHQAIYSITVTPRTGLVGTIALSCSGAPANSTCSVSPSTVNLGGPPVMSTVTLSSSKNVTHGTSTLTFTATLTGGSNLSHSTTAQLTVQ